MMHTLRLSFFGAALLTASFLLADLAAQTTNSQYHAGFREGRLAGRADVRNNPSAFELVSRTNIPGVRLSVATNTAFTMSVGGTNWTRFAQTGAPTNWSFNTNTGVLAGAVSARKRTVRITPYSGSKAGPRMTIQFKAPPVDAYREQDVVFGSKQSGVELAGTLTVPRGPGPFPAVVLVAGSGPMNRDEEVFGHRPFAVLADHLARRGLVVLRYDKRGVGKSTGDFAQATTQDFAVDAISAWDFLAARPEVDAKRVGAIGHSEGGMIVPTLGANRAETAFIVMLAGVGMSGGDLELLQSSLLKKAGGMDPADLAFEEETTRRWIAMVKAGDSDDQIEQALRPRIEAAAAKTGEDAERAVARLHSPWWRFILTHSAIPDLEKVRCPVMALNGSKDLQVPPRENLEPIAQALARAGNTDFVIREMPGLNHLFQHAETGSESEYAASKEAISPQVVAMVGDWILDRTSL